MNTDILIIGAGIAGCIMALAMRPRYSVTLMDKYATPQPKPGDSLPPAASRILTKLDLTTILSSDKHLTCHGMTSNWASPHPITSDNLRNPDGMGWHVDRQQLERDLRAIAQQRGVQLITPATITQANFDQTHWQCIINHPEQKRAASEQTVHARLVIDATGRHSTFARQFATNEHNKHYKRQQFDKLMSVWLSYPSNNSQALSTLIPAENGWWYSAPLPNLPTNLPTNGAQNAELTHRDSHCRMLAWQTDADLMDKAFISKAQPPTQQHLDPVINTILTHAAHHQGLAQELESMDTQHIQYHGMVAANSSRLKQASGENWFAIGDAAMSFDPLSSQGMFNGMATAMQLADLLNSSPYHSAANLNNIAQTYQRQLDNIWQHYLTHRDYYYSQETRWSRATFWQRRQQ